MFTVTDVDVVWLTSGGEWISGFKLMLGGIRSFVCFFNEKSSWVTKDERWDLFKGGRLIKKISKMPLMCLM